ncbi:MAG: protoporphyrinogen oxidase [Silicimonas sp.]|jgi:menaquinone-dependent protoporphyrinogen oxidase|nr:protoporphyrinogen oxidase [Silicimonas sp.]
MSVLIAFGTVEGQTGKIARFVEDLAQEAGESTVLFDTSDKIEEVSFDGVEKVILAASVHQRRHPAPFEVFVSANREELSRRKTLLLSVSLSAAFPEGHEEAQDYADEMKMRTGLEPDAELLVAGAFRADRYDFYAMQVIKHVVLRGREFDPDKNEHEFTNWDELAAKVTTFLTADPA